MLSHYKRCMEIRFRNYRFLPEPMVLYRDGEIIPLKHNQTLLLHLFLDNPEKIHSKDAIMNFVWKNKVVSEQVVFQTISQLRALLGDNAIQTFSKKGYKWTIAIEAMTESSHRDNQYKSASISVPLTSTSPELQAYRLFMFCL
jgi:DNA-binding winged helix-turn-helix (wHTH) protein